MDAYGDLQMNARYDYAEKFTRHNPIGKLERILDYTLIAVAIVCTGWVINLLLGEWR